MDIKEIRKDFPILSEKVYNKPLVYLDNGATTQMPECVMNCWREHYCHENANVHRGIHYLSERSTMALEKARETAAEFIGSDHPEEIVFTSGATDSLNLAAFGYAFPKLRPGRKVIVTEFEHHSNYVPWQQAAKRAGAEFVVIPRKGDLLDLSVLERELDKNTVMLSVTAVSNVTGTRMPLERIIPMAHDYGIPVCVDASQAMRHGGIDVKKLDCDFLAFSGHKMMGPGGTGVLYGKKEYLEQMEPVRFGGGMVDQVGREDTTFGDIPYRFEAGTPNYPGSIALAKAMEYLLSIGLDEIAVREDKLTIYLEERLRRIEGITIMGGSLPKHGVVSAAVEGVHPYDLASFLDKLGIAARSGSHCAQPLLRSLGYEYVIRFSPAFYNTEEEIDILADAMNRSVKILRKWS